MYKETDALFYELSNEELISLLLWGEARGESDEGQLAITQLLTNRVNYGGWFLDAGIIKKFPDKPYHAVILKNAFVKSKKTNKMRFIYQFSCFQDADPTDPTDDDPNRVKLLKMAAAGSFPLLQKVQVFMNLSFDSTGGACYYYNPAVVKPVWADSMTKTAWIGNHVFLKNPKEKEK